MSLSKASSQSLVPTSLPPTALTFLKWLELTSGRDKIYRFIAYFSKFVIQQLKRSPIEHKDLIDRLSKGASAIGTTRKLIRFFRALEYFNELLKSFALQDDIERALSIWKSVAFTLWMLCDHIQWLQKAGYLRLQSLKAIDEYHSKMWFYGLIASVILCVYKLQKLQQERAKLTSSGGSADTTKMIQANADKQAKTIQSLVKNSIDSVIPAARLKWLPISDGTVGLAGAITSVIGMYDTWPSRK